MLADPWTAANEGKNVTVRHRLWAFAGICTVRLDQKTFPVQCAARQRLTATIPEETDGLRAFMNSYTHRAPNGTLEIFTGAHSFSLFADAPRYKTIVCICPMIEPRSHALLFDGSVLWGKC